MREKNVGRPLFSFPKAVSRNIERFPEDFMFKLSKEEFNLIFQFGTSSWGGIRKMPRAFTEQGVAMLSSVLNSKRSIAVNIQIMRTFAQMRQMMLSYKELKEKIEKMESKYDKQFRIVFQALKQLLEPPKPKQNVRRRRKNSEDRVLMKIKKEKIFLASPFNKGGKRGIAAAVCFAVLVFNVSSLYAAWANHIVISEVALL